MKANSSVCDTIEPKKTKYAAPQDRLEQLKKENRNELAAAGQEIVSFEAYGKLNPDAAGLYQYKGSRGFTCPNRRGCKWCEVQERNSISSMQC